MAAELTEELKVLVTAEVDKAIKGLKDIDSNAKKTENSFKVLGKTISTAFIAKELFDFGKQSVAAFEDSKRAANVLTATLEATGATAWITASKIKEMASSLQEITNFDDDSIIKMQTVLLGFKNITGDAFEHATKAILDMATVMNMDLASAAQTVGKALDDPINGITSLQKQGFRFTAAQKEIIESLIQTGDTAAAQKIILDELDTTYGGAAESAAQNSVKIKNAWGDLQKGVGEFLKEIPFIDRVEPKLAGLFQTIGQGFATFWDNVDEALHSSDEKFGEWYDSLADTRKLELAEKYYLNWLDEVHKAKTQADINAAVEETNFWRNEYNRLNALIQGQIESQQEAQRIENERIAAETEISELMYSISQEYDKLSKDDPVVQLENYQKQLEDIEKQKQKLQEDTTGADVSTAIEQLDYSSKAVTKKMEELRAKMQDDGVKSWQSYFEKVTGVSEKTFTTGKEAGDAYIAGLDQAFNQSKDLAELMGNKFDAAASIEDEMQELEQTITKLLSIPADEIDEAYSTVDNSIAALIDRYKQLNDEKKTYENAATLAELQQRVDEIGKTEEELYIIKLQENAATDEQIQKAKELYGIINNESNVTALAELQQRVDEIGKTEEELYIAKLKENGATDEQIQKAQELYEILNSTKEVSWDQWIGDQILPGIEALELFTENAKQSNAVIKELGVSLINLGINSTFSGIEALGKALGEGKEAGDSMKDALTEMANEILNQLPTLFLQAGLQLIAQGQWPLGLSFIAAGATSSFLNGLNQGYQNREENALGGVYGDSSYAAFAKGGAFTNSIVSSPTLFRFAKGNGFGTGLMGEAGPEAIMPLERGPDGRLGIDASGAGTYVDVKIDVNNYSSENVEAHEVTDESGQKKIEITIGSIINNHITSGKADKAMSARFGIRSRGV